MHPTRQISVNLRFNKMADFTPVAVARQVPATAKLLEAREQLANLLRYMDGKVAAEDQLKKLLADPQLMAALRERAHRPADRTWQRAAKEGMGTMAKASCPQREHNPGRDR